jgi:hypothetical protein
MSWSTALVDLMPNTLLVRPFVGVSTDGYARPVYSTALQSYRARVVRKNTLVRTFEGTEELASWVAWVLSTSTFDPSSKVSLSPSTVVIGPIMAAEQYPDENGRDHLKLLW